MTALDFVHVYQPPPSASGARTLLLLHGTGGDEKDLLPVAQMLDPAAGVLSPRGKVLEHGMPRFFRRLAEGVFDEEDLRKRTGELADFIGAAAERYGFDPNGLTAVGFSNGANIASSLLLLRPQALAAAVLFRGMVPLVPDTVLRLPHTPVLLSNGRRDPIVAVEETERLAALLRQAGADVTLTWQPAGHELTQADIAAAKTWLTTTAPSPIRRN